jgi:3-oxoacyl-[acyl-carrier protein] reductase
MQKEGAMTSPGGDEHPGLGPGLGRLKGKVAVVTGAESGIGRATARLFAREGAKVVCADIKESATSRIDKLIQRDGGEGLFVQADATTRAGCEKMVAAAAERYGGLDILFNNVGDGVAGRIDEYTDEQWNYVVNMNLNSVYHGVRAALPQLQRRGRGAIVSTASSLGILALERYPAYCATKAAIVNLTRQLAIDYGPNIRVNCVCPGATATPRLLQRLAERGPAAQQQAVALNRAMGRLARPEEIAYGVLFLASDEASFVTGHALLVDGGQTIDA